MTHGCRTADVYPDGHMTPTSIEDSPDRRAKHCPRCGKAMTGKLVGKEFVRYGEELHKSRTSLRVLDVIFEETSAGHWDVYALTERRRYQIGTVDEARNSWIGSRDLIATQDGNWVRPFLAAPSGESSSKDKEDFIAQWKGSLIFVHPELPNESEDGDIHLIGGESILIEAWLNQSRIWMRLAVETTSGASLTKENMSKSDVDLLNVACIMAGYSIELVFKCLAWIGGADIQPIHKIGPFYSALDDEMKSTVNTIAIHNGWLSADELVDYADSYLEPVNRRYFGVSTGKEFGSLRIRQDDKITALANAHQGICEEISRYLKSPIK